MAIDTKRLETDAAYWDEVAPEGCDLYLPSSGFSNGFFLKSSDGLGSHKAIPRPTKPVSPEGVDGLPCVGSVVAPDWSHFRYRVEWVSGDGQVLISEIGAPSNLKITETDKLKSLNPEIERQEDELSALFFCHGMSRVDSESCAKIILSRYNLEPKP